MLIDRVRYDSAGMSTNPCTMRYIMLSLSRSLRSCRVSQSLCDAAGTAVIVSDKSCRPSLDLLNLSNICVVERCPGCRGILQYRTDKVLVGSLLCSLWCRSNVPLKHMVEFAFLETLSACLPQDRSLHMVTPRYFVFVLMASFWSWIN